MIGQMVRLQELLEAVNDIKLGDTTNNHDFNTGDYHVNLDDILQDHVEISVCQSQQLDGAQKYKGKKRKLLDRLDKVCEVLREINSNENKRLQKLARRVGYDDDSGKSKIGGLRQTWQYPGTLIG